MADLKFNVGSFVPLLDVFDDQLIRQLDPDSEQFKEFLTRLRTNINNIAIALNTKDTGFYVTQSFVNGQVFFPNPSLGSSTPQQPTYRQVYRKVINFGTLPNAATTSVAHGITTTAAFTFTRIYGCATNPNTSFIPLPYASPTLNKNIELNADATNVNITTGIDRTAYTTTYVVLEYINQ